MDEFTRFMPKNSKTFSTIGMETAILSQQTTAAYSLPRGTAARFRRLNYTDFESLLRLLIHKEKAEEDSRASPSETSDWFVAYPGGSEYVNGEDARDIRIDELVSEEDIDPEDIHVFPANTELC